MLIVLKSEHPLLSNSQLEKIRNIAKGHFKSITIPLLFNPDVRHNMRERLDQICNESVEAVKSGISLIILSDRGVDKNCAAIPSLLAVQVFIIHY